MNPTLLTNKNHTIMKKIFLLLPLALLVNSCVFFEMDNYDGPNASISGRIIDSKTKENVPTECKFGNFFGGAYFGSPTTGYFSVFEKGRSEVYDIPIDYEKAQYWHIKYDGTYVNTKVFSGTYRIAATADNFYPVTKDDVKINKGENTLDWEVVPYCRVVNPKIELVGDKFVATFAVEFGDPTKANTVYDAKLLCYPDAFVGMYCNYCNMDQGASSRSLVDNKVVVTPIVADGKTLNTLTIDPKNSLNQAEFKYASKGKEHFFRIAVCAQGNGANASRYYNYSPTVVIKY